MCAVFLNVLTQKEMKTEPNISILEHNEVFFFIFITLILSKLASEVINISTYHSPYAVRIDLSYVIMSSKYIYLFCALDGCNSTSNAVSPLVDSLIAAKGKLLGAVNKKILSRQVKSWFVLTNIIYGTTTCSLLKIFPPETEIAVGKKLMSILILLSFNDDFL